ncbi:uncharacterized protein LOC127241730 isoform X4 [Andrographis paniculata]|uniref:uncharacterized protein LOC127241730 isoform X4 n=1 Tax=Andrographis paniculata TaxID=175694 RepID=UPI0021E93356|nr:uncharacterized protein LOC127241730 isoform X4 [Andrographis paniculata]
MANEADISVPIIEKRTEISEQERNMAGQGTIISICKLSEPDTPNEPLTLESEDIMRTSSAGEVGGEIDNNLPEASTVAEKPSQDAKDDPEIFLGNLKSGDQPSELAVNLETSSEMIQGSNVSDKDGGRSIAPVEHSKNLNVQVNTGNGKTTEDNITFNLPDEVSGGAGCPNNQNESTSEQEHLGNEMKLVGKLKTSGETITDARGDNGELQGYSDSLGVVNNEQKTLTDKVTDKTAPKVTEKTENSSLAQLDGLHTACNQQLEKENGILSVPEASTGSIGANESPVNLNITAEDEDLNNAEPFQNEKHTSTLLKEEMQIEKPTESLHAAPENLKAFYSDHDNKATSSQEEHSTSTNLQAIKSEDTEEKTVDGAETQKGVNEFCIFLQHNVPHENNYKNSLIQTDGSHIKHEGLLEEEMEKPLTEASSEKQIQTVDQQEASIDKKQEITQIANKREEGTKDIATNIPSQENGDTSPTAEHGSEPPLEEVPTCNANDNEQSNTLEAKSEKYADKDIDDPLTEASSEKEIHAVDPQKTSPDKTKEVITEVAGAKEVITKDITIKVLRPENEDTSPIAEESSEPSLIEGAVGKASDNEFSNFAETKSDDGSSLKAELVENDNCTEKEMEKPQVSCEKQLQIVGSKEISPDNTNEDVVEVDGIKEESKDTPINVPNQENQDTSLAVEDGSQKPCREVVICKSRNNEPTHTLEAAKFKDESSLKAQSIDNDICPESLKTFDSDHDKATSSQEEHSTGTNLQDIKSEDTEEKSVDATETPKEVNESSPMSQFISHQEESTTADQHEGINNRKSEIIITDVTPQKEAPKNFLKEETEENLTIKVDGSQMNTKELSESGNSSSSITLARESNHDSLMIRHEAEIEDGQQSETELGKSEEHTEGKLPKIASETKMEENTLPVASEKIKASDLCQEIETSTIEQTLTADPQGLLDDPKNYQTDGAATKDETLEESMQNVATFDADEENKKNSLIHFDGFQTEDEHHLEKESDKSSLPQDFQRNTSDLLSLKDKIEIEKEKPGAELFETDNYTESAALTEVHLEKPGKSLSVAKASDMHACSATTSCSKEQSLSENQQAMLGGKIEENTMDTEATNQTHQKLQQNAPHEDNDKNSMIQTDGSHIKHEELLEKEMEKPWTDGSCEKQIQTVDQQEDSIDKTKQEITQIAEKREEGTKRKFLQDIATNIPSQGNEYTSPTAEHGSEPPLEEVSTCNSNDNEQSNTLEAKFEKYADKDIDDPLTEASSEKEIHAVDPQKTSPDKTKEVITEVAGAKEVITKDITIKVLRPENEDTSPIAEESSEPSLIEGAVGKASDNEFSNFAETKSDDGSSLKAELVENDNCTEKEMEKPRVSCEKQLQIVGTKEISPDKTKEDVVEVDGIKEESKDTPINVPNQENHDTSPEVEDGSQRPCQEVVICKSRNNEPTQTLEAAKYEDDSSSKEELVDNDICPEQEIKPSIEASSEKEIQPTDAQENLSDKTHDRVADVEENNKDTATSVSSQENADMSPTVQTQETSLKEDSTYNASDNETQNSHEAKLEEENFLNADHEESTERASGKEEVPTESLCVADKDIKSIASGQERETSSPQKQILTEDPQVVIYHDTEDKTNKATGILETHGVEGVETAIPHENTEEQLIKVHSPKMDPPEHLEKESEISCLRGDTTESTLIIDGSQVDKSIDYMQASINDIKESASGQELVKSAKEGQILTTGFQEISVDKNDTVAEVNTEGYNEDKVINAGDLNAETPVDKGVETTVAHEEAEERSLTQAVEEQYEHLEKVLEHPSKVEALTGSTTDGTLMKEESQAEMSNDCFLVDNKDNTLSTSSLGPDTSSIEEITSNMQEFSILKTEEETSGTSLKKETLDEQKITAHAPTEESEDDLKNSSLKEDSMGTTKDHSAQMHEAKFESKDTIANEFNDRSIDGTLGKGKELNDALQVVVSKDVVAFASDQGHEKPSSLEEENMRETPEKIMHDPKEDKKQDEMHMVEIQENKNAIGATPPEDPLETTQVQLEFSREEDGRLLVKENENVSLRTLTEPPKVDTPMLKEEAEGKCIGSLEVLNEQIKQFAPSKENEISSIKENTSDPELPDVLRAQTVETLDIKDISEDYLHTEQDTSQMPSLEETPKSNDTDEPSTIHETKPIQEGLIILKENITVKTDQNASEVAGDSTNNKCSEQLEENDTIKSLVEYKKHRASVQEERECREERALLDETEDAKDTTSTIIANEFVPNSSEASDEYQSTSDRKMTKDREGLDVGTTGNAEDVKIDGDKDKGEEEIKQTISDLSHTALDKTEKRDENLTILRSEASEGDSPSKDLGVVEEVESIYVEKTSDSTSHCERDESEPPSTGSMIGETSNLNEVAHAQSQNKSGSESEKKEIENIDQDRSCEVISEEKEANKEMKLKAGEEIHNDEVLSEGISSNKMPKDFGGAADKSGEQPEDNLLAYDSYDRSLHQNELDMSIADTEVDHQVDSLCVETRNEESKEDIITEYHPEDKEKIKAGEMSKATMNMNKAEQVNRVSAGAAEEPIVNFLAKESKDQSLDQKELGKDFKQVATILDSEKAHETDHLCVETKAEDPKEVMITGSHQEDVHQEELHKEEISGVKRIAAETVKASEVSKEPAQRSIQQPEENMSGNANTSLQKIEVAKSTEDFPTIGSTEKIHAGDTVYIEVKTEDAGEKASKVYEDTASNTEERPEDIDRSLHQIELDESISEVTTIYNTEEAQKVAGMKIEDSKEEIAAQGPSQDGEEQKEIGTGEVYKEKNNSIVTNQESEGSREAMQDEEEDISANVSLDRSVCQTDIAKNIEEDTAVVDAKDAHRTDHVSVEAKTKDSIEEIVAESYPEYKEEQQKMEEIFEVKNIDGILEEPKSIEEVSQQPEEDIANKSDNRSIHKPEMEKSVIKEVASIVDGEEAHGVNLAYPETKSEDSKDKIISETFQEYEQEVNEKEICEVHETVPKETVQKQEETGNEVEVVIATLHTEKPHKVHPSHLVTEFEESKEEVSSDIEKVAEKAVPEPQELGQGIEVAMAAPDTKQDYGIHLEHIKNEFEESTEELTRSTAPSPEDKINKTSSDEDNEATKDEALLNQSPNALVIATAAEVPETLDKNIICEAVPSPEDKVNKTSSDEVNNEVTKDEALSNQSPNALMVATAAEVPETLDKDIICEAVPSPEDKANKTSSHEANNEATKDEALLNQSPDAVVIATAAEVPETLDKMIICEAVPTVGVHETTQDNIGKREKADVILEKEQEVENKGKDENHSLSEFTQKKEGAELDQNNEAQVKDEEDAQKADRQSKTVDKYNKTDTKVEDELSSHTTCTTEVSRGGGIQEISNNEENATPNNEWREEKYANEGTEFQKSTVEEDFDLQESKPTMTAAIPETVSTSDPCGLPETTEVHCQQEEDVRYKSKGVAESSAYVESAEIVTIVTSKAMQEDIEETLTEAQARDLKRHDLPQESVSLDFKAQIGQTDCSADLHNVKDIGVDVQKSNECSIGVINQGNPVEEDPIPEIDSSKNVNPQDSTGNKDMSAIQHVDSPECPQIEGEILKPSDPDSKQEEEVTTKSMEKPEMRDRDQPSLSDLFQAAKESTRLRNDPISLQQQQQAEHGEHKEAKSGEEKSGEEESEEKRAEESGAEVKVGHKKSHNILSLSGVGSKVKHSISKVKKAITGKSSHHPK